MSGAVETEVKIRVPDLAAVEDRLKAAGFLLHVPRAFEANTLYDTPGQSLRMAGCILRLREVAGRHLLTFKGQEKNGPYKSREEVETTLGSSEAMHTVLAHLGYHPVFRYEKYRAEFKVSADAPGVVTLDHTPIGDFIELEGPSEWIDATARQLGYSPSDYLLHSYGKLYITDCERRRVEPTHMVFSS
jgi:adenylate cyclase, class 2